MKRNRKDHGLNYALVMEQSVKLEMKELAKEL
jgi:hypothetical protein